jgi:glycosyltransferase involved in cell wall biosynthesis
VLFNPANTAPLYAHRQVIVIHDVLAVEHPEWFTWRFASWYTYLLPRLIRTADAVLTTSTHSAAGIRRIGRAATSVGVVPQGLAPIDRPSPMKAIERAITDYAIAQPYVLAIGGGDPRKNIAFAQRVVQSYNGHSERPLSLVVVGARASRVHARANGDERHADIRRIADVPDEALRAIYSGATALLFPTLAEGFGRPPLEALCCGVPVITSRYDAGEDALADTPAYRLPLDMESWVATLRTIVHEGDRPNEAVRERLRARWSWDAAAASVLATCEQVADTTRRDSAAAGM